MIHYYWWFLVNFTFMRLREQTNVYNNFTLYFLLFLIRNTSDNDAVLEHYDTFCSLLFIPFVLLYRYYQILYSSTKLYPLTAKNDFGRGLIDDEMLSFISHHNYFLLHSSLDIGLIFFDGLEF